MDPKITGTAVIMAVSLGVISISAFMKEMSDDKITQTINPKMRFPVCKISCELARAISYAPSYYIKHVL